MKNLRLVAVVLGLFVSIANISCSAEDEPLDPAVLNPINPDCIAPSALAVTNDTGGAEMQLNWLAGLNESSWEVEYGITGFLQGSGTVVAADITSLVLTGLDPLVTYEFYVRSVCGDTGSSEWAGPVSSVDLYCPVPLNVVAERAVPGGTDVVVSWDAAAESYWQIQYGAPGFQLGSGTIINTNTNIKQLPGFAVTSAYDFYVRAACGPGESSQWTGPVHVTAVE